MPSDMDDYQKRARGTAVFDERNGVTYCALQLAAEAGEVAGKIAKLNRDTGIAFTDMHGIGASAHSEIVKEIGDVLWYVAVLADLLECDLSEVADRNLLKLADRKKRGVLAGSGDNR